MKLITWNVLHRVHAENWNEREVLEHHPNESERTQVIVARIAGWLADPEPTCVCLQEVSGDLLAALRTRFRDQVHSIAYPRVPKWDQTGVCPLVDRTEHLVTVVAGGVEEPIAGSAPKHGNGALAVRVGGLRILTSHLDFGADGPAQIAWMAAMAGDGPVALCGDFNRRATDALAALGPSFTLASAEVPLDLDRREGIDHVFVRGLSAAPLALGDRDPSSDHPPVAAWLYPG